MEDGNGRDPTGGNGKNNVNPWKMKRTGVVARRTQNSQSLHFIISQNKVSSVK